jgi:protein gp37
MAMGKRFKKWPERVTIRPDRLDIPLKRKKPTVYAIWNDLFHEDVPLAFIDDVLDVISASPQHTFLALTKRAHLIEEKLYGVSPDDRLEVCSVNFVRCRELGGGDYLSNLWVGVTVCNQEEADIKIPLLLEAWPGKKWISVEPMLGPIDMSWSLGAIAGTKLPYISSVVLGGETGPHARPMQPDWVRSIRDQCEAAGVPFFLKYLNKKSGRLLDGREHNELPWRLTCPSQ